MTSFLLQENGFFLLLENSGRIILTLTTAEQTAITGPIDVAWVPQSDGSFDIALDSFGELQLTNEIDTAIYMSILTDKRAVSSEVSIPQNQRGWWGNSMNAVPDYEIGSKLWLLDQSRRTADALNKAQEYIADCLKWLIDDKYVNAINVTVNFVDNGIEAQVQFS